MGPEKWDGSKVRGYPDPEPEKEEDRPMLNSVLLWIICTSTCIRALYKFSKTLSTVPVTVDLDLGLDTNWLYDQSWIFD